MNHTVFWAHSHIIVVRGDGVLLIKKLLKITHLQLRMRIKKIIFGLSKMGPIVIISNHTKLKWSIILRQFSTRVNEQDY